MRRAATVSLAAVLVAASASAASPVNGPAMALHQRLLTLDTHLDTPANLARPGWDIAARHDPARDYAQVDLPRMAEGGLDGGFFAIYTRQGARTPAATAAARDAALIRAVEIREMVARHGDRMELAFTADDAARIAASGKTIVYQSIENSYPLSGDINLLSAFYGLGVRMVGPVHFLNNDLGDSATDPKGPEWQGLSPLGKQLVAEANRLGMILDASHASDAVFDQLIALSRTPIILSHSGCKAVYDNPRNIDDARLRTLAASGGVIQINAYGGYVAAVAPDPERDAALAAVAKRMMQPGLTADAVAALVRERDAIRVSHPPDKPDFDAFLKHLLHALKLVGPDHVGIGLDWDGGGGVRGMTDVSMIPRITEALLKAGYGEAELQKIWSGNVLGLLRAAEAGATRP